MIVSVPQPLPNALPGDSNNSGSKSNLSPKPCLRERREIFRVNDGHSLRRIEARYRMMEGLSKEYAVRDLCEFLGMSRSGYYLWKKDRESAREQANHQAVVVLDGQQLALRDVA